MIAAGLVIYGGLFLAIGILIGSFAREENLPEKNAERGITQPSNTEMQNFLAYDGTEQK